MGHIKQIGLNLSLLRRERGLSISGLAELSGVAKSTLSSLELGEGNPTVETLWATADALGVTFGRLVQEAQAHGQGADGLSAELKGEGSTVRLIERSQSDDDLPVVEVYAVDLAAGYRREAEPHTQGVQERVTVLSGALLVGTLARPVLLRAGETLVFAADVPHIYAAHSAAKALVVVQYPPGLAGIDSALRTVDWPGEARLLEGAGALVDRLLIDTSNGLCGGRLRFRGAPLDRAAALKPLLGLVGARQPEHRWPVMAFADTDADGAFVAALPLLATSAFSLRESRMQTMPPIWAAAQRLSAWAETPARQLTADERDSALRHVGGASMLLESLGVEVLLQRGQTLVPTRVGAAATVTSTRVGKLASNDAVEDGSFSSRIDVAHHNAYELLHPAYARQVVAMAQDIQEFVPQAETLQTLDVGTGPGLPLLMLKELLPHLQTLAVEPDPVAFGCLVHNVRGHRGIELHQGDFLSMELPAASLGVVTSTGASHHFNTAFMLQKAMTLLQPGGVLVVADEFLPAFSSALERQAGLVRHHGAYLVAMMAWLGPCWPSQDDAAGRLYRDVRRTLTDALLWVDGGRTAQAVELCRSLAPRLHAVASPSAQGDLLGAVLRFFRLEWQAMVAGFDYEVERKTHPRHFLALARMAGFTLLRHRRLFATTGHDDMGGGTHLFTFAKPKDADGHA